MASAATAAPTAGPTLTIWVAGALGAAVLLLPTIAFYFSSSPYVSVLAVFFFALPLARSS
jgi:hypothetical protein